MLNNYIETPRLLLRTYVPQDGDAVWAVLSRREIYATTYAIPKDYPRPQVDWWFRFLSSARRNKTGFEFGIFDKLTNTYVGNCGIINVQNSLHCGAISYFVNPDLWGKGYATEAGKAIVSFAFSSLRLHRISGRCLSTNPASRRVMEKLGFIYEGTGRDEIYKDGLFLNVDHLALLQNDFFV